MSEIKLLDRVNSVLSLIGSEYIYNIVYNIYNIYYNIYNLNTFIIYIIINIYNQVVFQLVYYFVDSLDTEQFSKWEVGFCEDGYSLGLLKISCMAIFNFL